MSHPSFYRSKQKTAYSHVGSNTELDDNLEYVKNQSDLLQSQQQQSIGNIPSNIARVHHSDVIQSVRYGIPTQEILHGSNIYADKYHPYNPYYDWLYTKGLLKENFKTRINTTYINVDSSSRTISPKMITINDTKLGNNPLSYDNKSIEVGIMTSTQNLLKISYPNHTLSKNDRITLTGLEKTTIQIKTIYSVNGITKTAVIFTPGSSSVIFVCNYDEDDTESPMSFNPNFKIGEEILHDTLRAHDMSDVLVSISGFDISSIGTPYIGNVPINFLNSTHVMYLTNPDYSIQNGEIVYSSDDIINKPNDNGYVTKITGFYIKLSAPFSGDVPERSSILTLTFNHFGGYPINKLNAEFPIDENHLIGYHQIYSVGIDYVTVAIEKSTYYENSNFGGDDIYISQVTSLKNGYTESNNYKIELPKMIHNVVIAKLISTAFPNTSKIFRNNKNDSNNKLYWQNHDDGDYVYNIEINPGNYSHTSLSRLIETKINSVPKRYAKGATTNTTYTNMNFMTVNIDDETDIVTFKSFNEVILTKPIQSISPEISDTNDGIPPYIVTILHVSHGLKEGDTVLFSGMISTMGIPESVLNSYHIITSVPTDDTYTILINNFNLSSESRINTGGGNAVKSYIPLSFRLLFNYPDTMGTALGFRHVGESTSITKYNTIIKNSDEYQDEIITTDQDGIKMVFDESGNKIALRNNALQMSGNSYAIMVIREFSNIINVSNAKNIVDCFAKINLSQFPGTIIYDSFVASPAVLYDPIDLSELNISIYSSNGIPYDFNGLDHSFVLEITSIDYVPQETGIVSSNSMF